MAAPVIEESTKHAFASNATSYTITGTTLPNFAAGDLCLIFCSTDGAGNALTAHFNVVGGDQALTVIGYSGGDTPSSTWFYRWCTGVELDVDVHILGTNSETCEAIAMRISGVTHEFPLIIPVPAVATSQNPDPPAVPALKEARDVLFLAAESNDHTDTWASDPTNYATVQHGNSGTGSGDCGGSVAYRAITNTSLTEDPGTFGLSGSEEYVAWTIAVLGDLSPVVAEQNAVAVPTTAVALGKADSLSNAQVFAFTPRESCNIEKIAFYAAKVGSPTDDVAVLLEASYTDLTTAAASSGNQSWSPQELYGPGGGGTCEGIAQRFSLAATTHIHGVQLGGYYHNTPTDNFVVSIVSALDGTPLASLSVPALSLPSSDASFILRFPSVVQLASGTYYLQLSRSGARDTTNYVFVDVDSAADGYAGHAYWLRDSGVWTENPSGYDLHALRIFGTTTPIAATTVDVQVTGWYEATFASPYAVTAGTTYWVVIGRTGAQDSTNYYSIYYGASANPLQTSYTNTTGTTYVEHATYDYSFQARKTTAVEWTPVDPMGASGFFGV